MICIYVPKDSALTIITLYTLIYIPGFFFPFCPGANSVGSWAFFINMERVASCVRNRSTTLYKSTSVIRSQLNTKTSVCQGRKKKETLRNTNDHIWISIWWLGMWAWKLPSSAPSRRNWETVPTDFKTAMEICCIYDHYFQLHNDVEKKASWRNLFSWLCIWLQITGKDI